MYVYSANSAFPSQRYNATNYWVDIVFGTTAPPTLSNVQASALTSSGASITDGRANKTGGGHAATSRLWLAAVGATKLGYQRWKASARSSLSTLVRTWRSR